MDQNQFEYFPEQIPNPTHLDYELARVRRNVLEMWNLVINQHSKAEEALMFGDKELAKEVRANEKRVDAMELSITIDCENILALYNPVAVDLRFVLAILKISYNLERIGDYAKTIARIAENGDGPIPPHLVEKTGLGIMFNAAATMLHEVHLAFKDEDNKLALNVFSKDEVIDKINRSSKLVFIELIHENPDQVSLLLDLLNVIRRLERVGDQSKNISEEIIFYLEARVVKHNKNAQRPQPE